MILFVSCSNQEMTLKQYANYPVKFGKQKIEYPNNDFSLFIPNNWIWKVENYEYDKILLGIDAASEPDKDGFINIISIKKFKSIENNNDIALEFEYFLNLTKNSPGKIKLIESGKTDIFNNESFYIHSKSNSGNYGELETIDFIIQSEIEGVYYNLTASASQTKELNTNMAIMIQCLKTFENMSE